MASVIRGNDNFDSASVHPTRTWQNPSRTGGTIYRNTTGHDIFWVCSQDARHMYVSSGTTNGSFVHVGALNYYSTCGVVVPHNHYYYRDGSGSSVIWAELR